MGLRFRKSIKIAPGVKVNIGKKSAGVSIGGKYGGVSFNTKSGARVRASAPGTGISYSTKLGVSTKSHSSSKVNSKHSKSSDLVQVGALSKENKYQYIAIKNNLTKSSANTYKNIFTIISVISFVIGIPSLAVGVGFIFIIIGAISCYYAMLYKKIRNYISENPDYKQVSITQSEDKYVNSLYCDMNKDIINYEMRNQVSSTYYSGMEEIESMWSVMHNLKIINGEKANEFEIKCKNNIYDLYKMLEANKQYGYDNTMPPHVPAYVRLAMLYEKQERYQEAINICVEAINAGAVNDGNKGKMYGRLARLIRKSGIQVNNDVVALSMKTE